MNVKGENNKRAGVEETSQQAVVAPVGTPTYQICDFLLSLPTELSSTVLTCWLDLTDIARLDSAMCTHQDREVFLTTAYQCTSAVYDSILHSDQVVKRRNRHSYGKPEFLHWVLLRKVRLSSLAPDSVCGAGHRKVLIDIVWMSRSCLKTVRTRFDFSIIGKTLKTYCTALESLSFSSIRHKERARWLDELLDKCPALRHLKFASCDSHASSVLRKYGARFQSLRMAEGWEEVSARPDWPSLIPHLPNLTELEITGACPFIPMLEAVAKHLMHLRVLRTSVETTQDNLEESDSAMRCVAQSCLELEVLDLGTKHAMEERTFREFQRNCKKLTVLRVNTVISSYAEAMLARNFSALKELRVRSFTIISRNLACWPLLEVLDVTYMSDEALGILGAHCPRLRVLAAERCELVTDTGVLALAKGCPLLQSIYLSKCGGVTIAAVKAVMSCRFFESLELRGGDMRKRITPAMVAQIWRDGEVRINGLVYQPTAHVQH